MIFRKQKTKIGLYSTHRVKVILGIPQGYVLGSLLFNIFVNDTFLIIEISDICKLANDNTMHPSGNNLCLILNSFEHDVQNLLLWFKINQNLSKLIIIRTYALLLIKNLMH